MTPKPPKKPKKTSDYTELAIRNYRPLSLYEFTEDFDHFKSVKRILNKHNPEHDRLLLNHLVTIKNLFESSALCRILFETTDPETHDRLTAALRDVGIDPV